MANCEYYKESLCTTKLVPELRTRVTLVRNSGTSLVVHNDSQSTFFECLCKSLIEISINICLYQIQT